MIQSVKKTKAIRSGDPIPKFRGRGRPRIYPLDQMTPGDSLELETTYDVISKCIRQLTRKGAGRSSWKFRINVLEDKRVQVWRLK